MRACALRFESAGGLNPKQPSLILCACKALSAGSEVVTITHDDFDGKRYASVIKEMAIEAFLACSFHRPEGVKDWNDALKAKSLCSFPAVRDLW